MGICQYHPLNFFALLWRPPVRTPKLDKFHGATQETHINRIQKAHGRVYRRCCPLGRDLKRSQMDWLLLSLAFHILWRYFFLPSKHGCIGWSNFFPVANIFPGSLITLSFVCNEFKAASRNVGHSCTRYVAVADIWRIISWDDEKRETNEDT